VKTVWTPDPFDLAGGAEDVSRLARGVAGWSSVFQVEPFRITLFEVMAAWTYSPHSWHARDR
jgi:hypothetical protein